MASGRGLWSSERSMWACVLIAGGIFLGIVGLAAYDWWATTGHPDWESPGIRGDFFGGHLAAAAGIAGTVLFFGALMLQRRELQLQRRELEQGRKVAESQAQALRAQAGALQSQTEELRLQNALAERRDEVQFVLSLAACAVDALRRQKDPRPAIRQAADYVAERAVADYARGLEILDLLTAAIVGCKEGDLVDAIESAARRHGSALTGAYPLATAGPWLDIAKNQIAQAYR
jgi:hypothetical protein